MQEPCLMSYAAADRPTNVRWLIVLFLMAFTALGHFNIARFVLVEMWRQGLF